jgi:MFS family permease
MVLNALHANHAVLGEDEADENAGTGSSPHRSKARTPATAEEEEEEEEEEDDDEPSVFSSPFCSRTFLVMLLVMIVDKADQMLVPSVYLELGEHFGVGPTFLGTVTLFRGLAQALVALFSGPIGDRYNRVTVCAAGVVFWGLATLVVAGAPNIGVLLFARTMNGVGLGLVIPLVQAMASDMFSNELTGRAFGLMGFMSNLGGAMGGFLATTMAAGSEDGWRGAFLIVGFLSLAVGALFFAVGKEPRLRKGGSSKSSGGGSGGQSSSVGGEPIVATNNSSNGELELEVDMDNAKAAWEQAKKDIMAVLKLRTFQCILLQGAFGEMPWYAMNFMTMWFELRGFSHAAAGAIRGVFDMGVTLGNVVGGAVSDWSERLSPDHGRVAVAQFTVFIGIPMWLLILFGLPDDTTTAAAALYGLVGFLTAASISWACELFVI